MKSLKKISSLVLCMLLLIGIPSALATEDMVEDLDFKNPSFEELDENGNPMHVDAYQGWDGEFVSLSTEQAHSGKNSVKISTQQSGYPWVRFKMDAPPDTDFTFSAWVYVEALQGSGFGIKTEWINGAGVNVRGADAIRINTMEKGKWVQITADSHSEPDVAGLWIYFRMYGLGTFYVDDVAGKITSTPPVGGVIPDEFFFYPEWTEGKTQISANALIYPKMRDGKAEVALKDGDTVLESTTLRLTDGLADWTYSTVKMEKEAHPYVLEATLYDDSDKQMGVVSRNVYRFNRPTALTPEGDYLNDDGSIFIPKIAYHIDTGYGFGGEKGTIQKQLEYAKSVGINTVQMGTTLAWYPENFMKMMDLLAEYDMKALISLYASRKRTMAAAGAEENIETTKQIVELVKDHPATFAYAVFDEPAVGRYGLTEQDLIDSYTLIRSIDKKHPTYVVVAPAKTGSEDVSLSYLTKYTDVVCYDPYPGTWDDPVASYIHEVQSAASRDIYRGKPTYTLLQTFDYGGYFPTAEEYRHMWYQAAIGGTKGIGYYSHQDAFIGENGEKIGLWTSDIWDDMVTFAEKEMIEAEKHFFLKEYPTVNKGVTDEYIYESWTDGKDIYMILLDKSPTKSNDRTETAPITVSVPITSANGRISVGAFTAREMYGAKGRSFSGENTLTVPLGWRDAVLYKITPKEAIDYSLLEASSFTDLEDYTWAEDAIGALLAKDIVNSVGEGLYGPGQAITRGDFAGFLMRTLGLSAESDESFSDVPEAHPYAKEIAAGKALGILNGIGDNVYMPDAEITRQDLVTICLRGLEKKGYDVTAVGEMQFGDEAEIAEYAKNAVRFMAEKEIVIGNERGLFLPKNNTTRAETAVILNRILNTVWKKAESGPIDSAQDEVENKEEVKEETEEKTPVVFEESEAEGKKAEKREEAISLLKALGIYAEDDAFGIQDAVTRGMAAKLLYKTMAPTLDGDLNGGNKFTDADVFNAYTSYIAAISDLGVMTGYGDGRFGTDDAITYDTAVAAIIKMLGYQVHAESLGGFPAGYLAKATQLGITNGVDMHQGAIRAGAFAELLVNALDIKIAEKTAYNGELSYKEGDTPLRAWHGVMLKKGYVEATYMASMTDPVTLLLPNEIMIGGEVFTDKTGISESFFGYRVNAFVTLEDEPKIIYIAAQSSTVATVIPASDILLATNTRITFMQDGKEHAVNVSDATLVYNGVPSSLDVNGAYVPDSGEVVAIENADKTVLVVTAYKDYVLDHVNKQDDLLYFKDTREYSTGLSVSRDRNAKHISFTDTDGNTLEVGECDEWNIISVAANGSFVKIVKSAKSVTGSVGEISTDSVLVDGTSYKLAKAFRKNAPSLIQLGQNLVLYMNTYDEVAAVDASGRDYLYGYVIGGAMTKGVDSAAQLKIFTENDEVKVYTLADEVKVGKGVATESYTKSTVFSGNNPVYQNGSVIKQLIRFTLKGGENSEITSIVTAQDRRSDFNSMTMEEREEVFTMDASAGNQREWLGLGFSDKSTAAFYGGSMRMWGSQFLSRSKTKIFVIPGENAKDEEYAMFPEGSLAHVGQGLQLTNFSIFDTDKDNVVTCVVWDTVGGAGESPYYNAPAGVVTGFGKLLAEDGEVLDVIKVMNMAGDTVSVPYNEETKLYIKNVLTQDSDPMLAAAGDAMTAPISNISVGDVISYEIVDGKATLLNYLFRVNYPYVIEKTFSDTFGNIGADSGVMKNYGSLSAGYGKVLQVGTYGVRVQTNAMRASGSPRIIESNPVYVIGGESVLLYDKTLKEARLIDKTEIREGDYVFHKRSTYEGSLIMVVR